MKNKLAPWEEGLAGQMKEHEFSFDPDALAGFESLLAAETTVAGESAPQEPSPAATQSGGMFTGKLMSLLLGTLVAGSLLAYFMWGGEEAVAATTSAEAATELAVEQTPPMEDRPAQPEISTLSPSLTSPSLAPAPAPAPTPRLATEPTVEPSMIGSNAPEVRPERNSIDLPRPRPISGAQPVAPRAIRALVIPALPTPKQAVVHPLNALTLPTVTIKLETARQIRDRNALFPEVIDN